MLCVSANRDYSPCKFVSPPSRPTLTCVEYGLFLCLFCTQLGNRETYCTHPKSPTVQVCAAGAWWGEVCMVPSWLVNLFLARLFWGQGVHHVFWRITCSSSSAHIIVTCSSNTYSDWLDTCSNTWGGISQNLNCAPRPQMRPHIHPIHVVQNYRWKKIWLDTQVEMRMGWTFSNRNLFILPRIVYNISGDDVVC